ncbi:MAG: hypothetical protein IJW17_11920 [Lentisphaeria bacterium]|nr:hypothetical protein [Lentisphaeria bacterium]
MLLSNCVPEAISLTVKVKGTDLTDAKLYIVDRERSMESNTFVYLEKI